MIGGPNKHNISWCSFHLARTQIFTSKQISGEICVQFNLFKFFRFLPNLTILLMRRPSLHITKHQLNAKHAAEIPLEMGHIEKMYLGRGFICSVPIISIWCASCMGKGWKRELLNRVENNSNVLMYSTAVYPNYIYQDSTSLLFKE